MIWTFRLLSFTLHSAASVVDAVVAGYDIVDPVARWAAIADAARALIARGHIAEHIVRDSLAAGDTDTT